MSWAPLALILAVAFAVRLIPRLIVPHALGSDTYFHLASARSIRENGLRLPDRQPRSVVEWPDSYPFLYHWLLALFPPRGAEVAERVSSAVCDTLLIVCTYAVAYLCGERIGLPAPELAAWAAFLVAFSPALLRVSSGPRAYRGTPRTLGQLLYGTYLGALVLHHLQPHPGLLAAAVIAIALLSIASKFSNQMVVFSSVLLLAAGYPEPALTAAAGYLLAIVLTRGRVWRRVLVGQYRHSSYYYRYLQQRYVQPENPSLLAHIGTLRHTGGRPKSVAHWLLTGRHPLHLLLVAFWPLPAGLILIAARPEVLQGSGRPLLLFTLTLCLVGAGLMFLIKLRPLLFLGECERYLEFMALPQALLVAHVALELGRRELLFACAVYSALITPVFLYLAVRSFRREERLHDELLPLLASIDQDGARAYPLGTYWWPLLYGTRRCQLLLPTSVDETIPGSLEGNQAAFGNYPFPTVPLAELVATYELDLVVTHTEALSAFEELTGAPAFEGLTPRLVAERGGYRVYDLRPAPDAT